MRLCLQVEPDFCTLIIKKDSRSEGSAPCVWGLSAGNALASGVASIGEGGVLGRSLEWRVSWDNAAGMDMWVHPRGGEWSVEGVSGTPMGE